MPVMTTPTMVLTFVVFHEDVISEDGGVSAWHVGQCLEVDVAAQGKTPSDALINVATAVAARRSVCAKLGMDDQTGPAPDLYWTMAGKVPPVRQSTH